MPRFMKLRPSAGRVGLRSSILADVLLQKAGLLEALRHTEESSGTNPTESMFQDLTKLRVHCMPLNHSEWHILADAQISKQLQL